MGELTEIYVRLFIIIPFLIFSGYSLTTNTFQTDSIVFHAMIAITFLTIFFFHVKHLIRIFQKIFNVREYETDFGVFLLMLSAFQAITCFYQLYQYHKRHKK